MELSLIPTIQADISPGGGLSGDITAASTIKGTITPAGSGGSSEPDGEISASLSVEQGIDGSLSAQQTLNAELVIGSSDYPIYDGPYDFTPSTEVQTINVSHTLPRGDITIQPIPSNYGLITWNGSTLTVS